MFKEIKDLKNRMGENPELKPIYIGMLNYTVKNKHALELAKKRAKTCVYCEFYQEEQNDLLKVNDKDIPELSNKQCGGCGCVLSFKLRQSINKCTKWQE